MKFAIYKKTQENQSACEIVATMEDPVKGDSEQHNVENSWQRADDQCDDHHFVLIMSDDTDRTRCFVEYSGEGVASIRERPDTPCITSGNHAVADGTDAVTLSDLPPGTEASITGPITESVIVNDGELHLTFTQPGRYVVTATAPFPAAPAEVIIDAS
jgi:hypothetical protein